MYGTYYSICNETNISKTEYLLQHSASTSKVRATPRTKLDVQLINSPQGFADEQRVYPPQKVHCEVAAENLVLGDVSRLFIPPIENAASGPRHRLVRSSSGGPLDAVEQGE
jgi:hypothetical protein